MQPTTKINEPIIIVDAKPISDSNSLKISYDYLHELKNNKINFQTFSGKAKVQFEDRNGRQPDANAIIRMAKDSIVWISLSSTFLNIEVIRILITPDTLIIINKLEKTVETYPYKYIRDIVQLPLTFSMLQDIIIGNPIFVGDSIKTSIISGNNILIETSDLFFQNLLTISTENHQLAKSQITESLQGNIRTATLEFNDYNTLEQRMFATFRSLKVENSSKIDCRISFREFEFNNELSFPFSIPGNYKTK
jgi:hypothetical protein